MQNKGIALFPRKIDGRYSALSRHENESNNLVLSDDVRHWSETAQILRVPRGGAPHQARPVAESAEANR